MTKVLKWSYEITGCVCMSVVYVGDTVFFSTSDSIIEINL